MDSVKCCTLFEGARLLSCQTERFKSSRITIRFAVHADPDTVSAFAAVPGLIRYTSKRYPGTMEMERKLASLYGAGFSAVASKAGDMQVLSFTISSVADRFALSGESIGKACLDFLLDCIFHPDLDEQGVFKDKNIKREKRLMQEDIKATMSDKMAYSLARFTSVFYEGEGAGVLPSGTLEQVEALDADAITNAWHTMLESAEIFVCAVGETEASAVAQALRDAFRGTERRYQKPVILPHKPFAQLREVHETQPLEQCKLNMGFSVESEDEYALRVLNMVFGRSEMSRLSRVVREKMSLCYYCSSAYGPKKKVLIVYSGIESANRDKAVEAVCAQLEAMKRGEIGDEEIAVAKRKLRDAYLSSLDTPLDVAQWYTAQMFDNEILSVEQCIAATEAVTKERIIACAQGIKADCIYSLGEKAQ